MEIIRKINVNKESLNKGATFFLTKINGKYWWKWDINYDKRKNILDLYIEESREYRDLAFRPTLSWHLCYHVEFKEEDLNE